MRMGRMAWVAALCALSFSCSSTTSPGNGDGPSAPTEPPTCQPTTCASLARSCGSASDGCGNTIDCGTCGEQQQCTAQGTCEAIPPNCTPQTCAGLSASCGD